MRVYAVLLSAYLLFTFNAPSVTAKSRSSHRSSPSVRSTGSRRSGSKTSSSRRSESREVQAAADPNDYDDDDYADAYDGIPPTKGDYDEYDSNGYDVQEEYDNFYDPYERSSSRKSSRRASESASRSGKSSRDVSSSRGPRGSVNSKSSGKSSRSVTAYRSKARPQPNAFAKSLQTLRNSIPDPATIKSTTLSGLSSLTEASSKISSNLYREIKGLTSSELEQVMLKATMPNDAAVKGKHVERLVGVTYQISGRYDIYDAVLRKLWGKMCERDWRTVIKALYVLHRFAADGAPDHQAALKARLRELRRTRDTKRKGEKYFNSAMILAGDNKPETKAFRAFLARYAHYVLLRAQCFGGMFTEIAQEPKPSSLRKESTKSSKSSSSSGDKLPLTKTCLKPEHLEASQMLLKAGLACALEEGEVCENTAIALERVVSDLIGLNNAVATALNSAIKLYDDDSSSDLDKELVKKWCEFYKDELMPKTKGMVKSSSPFLDPYGMFLPSRMGVSINQDLLSKGLKGDSDSVSFDAKGAQEESGEKIREIEDEGEEVADISRDEMEDEEDKKAQPKDDEDEMYDEYEYDEYEYDAEE